MVSWQDLFTEHVASSLAKQYAMADFLGEHNRKITLTQGTIDFGAGRVFPIQLLGSESEGGGTWQWAWANEASNLPEPVLAGARELRSLSLAHGLRELSEPWLSLDEVDGIRLAMVASGVCRADAYYRCPYEGGAAFVLVFDTPLLDAPRTPFPRMTTVIMNVVSEFEVDHRPMVTAFLQAEGFALSEESAALVGVAPDGRRISVELDDRGRLRAIKGVVTPSQYER